MPGRATRLLAGFFGLVLIGWGAGELWLSIVGSADLDAVREVAADRTQALTTAARAVTWAGSGYLLVPLALVCSLALACSGRRREALLMVLALGGAMLLSNLVKLLVSRPRPPVAHLQSVTGSSFPSGHATQASAFWFSLALLVGALGGSRAVCSLAAGVASSLVLAVAASRVYLGVHYPADVVAGVLLGAGWTAWVWHSLAAPHARVRARPSRPAGHSHGPGDAIRPRP
jgi:membrane-associated phospholipid phosphatase